MTETTTLQRISAERLFENMKSDTRAVVINALSRESYAAKHIPGSINIPTDEIEMVEQIVPDKQQNIVVYCANADCDASLKAAEALQEMGYENVWDFEEGLAGWKQAGYTLTGQDTA